MELPSEEESGYKKIEKLSQYEDKINEEHLRERYSSYPRVTFTVGACLGMVGYQWMREQLLLEQMYLVPSSSLNETLLNGLQVPSPSFNETLLNGTNTPMCYVNKKCGYDKNAVDDIIPGHNDNEVLSNVVYIVVGLGASIISCCVTEPVVQGEEGKGPYTVRHRGMYVNAGVSLMVEGCLSGLYHMCPTSWNNQFDYIGITMVALSLFLMLWSKRHPLIISVGTWATFVACILILGSLSALHVTHWSTNWVLEAVVYFLCFVIYFFFLPRLFMMLHYGLPFIWPESNEGFSFAKLPRALWQMSTFWFFLGTWVFGLVWMPYCYSQGTMMTAAIMKYSCAFLGFYMMWYIGNEFWEYKGRQSEKYPNVAAGDDGGAAEAGKLLDNDREAGKDQGQTGIWLRVAIVVVFVLTSLVMGLGMWFFMHDVYKTTVSIRESEKLNQECSLFWFDNHDLWHWCSGIALLGVIAVSMMLDHLNKNVPRKDLGVF